ncbi:hypothetical protein, partial [Pseudomonas viridiflava]|uniref:hypothetical protein n=1 Tax=Pseudomonas viridiflava TaxID=33069 RepID=UPI00197EA105
MITSTPRYSFEVIAADDDARIRVSDNSQIMGVTGRHFFVWDITNNANTSVFVILTEGRHQQDRSSPHDRYNNTDITRS